MNDEDLLSFYEGKNILITGGLGMMGSNLAHSLVKLNSNVLIVDSLLPLYGGNNFNLNGIEDKVRVNIADIRDESSMNQLVRDIDIIFNFAGQVAHNVSMEEPFLDLDINCRGQLNVLEACRVYNKDAKIVIPGSRFQFGKIHQVPTKEDHPQVPLSLYGVHKATTEMYCNAYTLHHGLDTVVFRIANPYGPRSQMKHSKYSMINWFLRLAMEGEPIKIFGDGQQIRDYIFNEDLTRAFLYIGAMETKNSHRIFNIGSGQGTRFVDMAETVMDVVGNGKLEYVDWPKNYENIETGDYVTDINLIKNFCGWKPKIGLEEGIRKTFEYYFKHKEKYW